MYIFKYRSVFYTYQYVEMCVCVFAHIHTNELTDYFLTKPTEKSEKGVVTP